MKNNAVSSLARSEDADLRAMGIKRLLYSHPLDEEGQSVLRLRIPSLELGQLLDHTGPIGASEKYAARVFGSHRTYA